MPDTIETLQRKTLKRLRDAVLKRGVPLTSIAARVGRSERTVRTWLDGSHDPPLTVLAAIEEAIR
jgi:hypothetical protein